MIHTVFQKNAPTLKHIARNYKDQFWWQKRL